MWLNRITSPVRRIITALFLIVIFSALQLQAVQSLDKLKFEYITQEQGLSNNQVTSIVQDNQGFLWFGTEDGLNRYDGYKFKVYRNIRGDGNSLSHRYVWTILKDNQGTLWIGTYGGGLNKYDEENDHFIQYLHNAQNPSSLSHNEVRCIYQDGSGTIWVGTKDGLNQLKLAPNGDVTFIRYKSEAEDPFSLCDNEVMCLFEDGKGVLWIGTRGGLNRSSNVPGKFPRYQCQPKVKTSLSNNIIRAIGEDNAGNLWVGTESGLNKFNRKNKHFTRFYANPKDPNSLTDSRIQIIRKANDGMLWIGTFNGLNIRESGSSRFIRYLPKTGVPGALNNGLVMSIYQDQFNIMWIGTGTGGINKCDLSRKPFAHYQHLPSDNNSLSDNQVHSIFEDHEGILWVGTFDGLNKMDRANGTFTRYYPNPDDRFSLSNKSVWAIREDKQKQLWIGTQGGLNRLDRKTGTFFHYFPVDGDPTSISSALISFIYEDSKSNLWIGTTRGLNRMGPQRKSFERFLHKSGNHSSLSGNLVTCIHEDSKGTLWVGTTEGLNRFNRKNKSFTLYVSDNLSAKESNKLSSNYINVIYEDSGGTLWVGTTSGLNKYDRKTSTFSHYQLKGTTLSNIVIFGILEDNNGNLWFSTTNGLAVLNPKSKTFKNYDSADGLQSNLFITNAFWKGKDGHMFFGGIKGFNSFLPEQIHDNKIPPIILITGLRIFDQRVKVGKEIEGSVILDKNISATKEIHLSYKHSSLTIDYAALHYAAPGKNRYKYMMKNLRNEWFDAGNQTYAHYAHLPPGEYVFKVKGANHDNIWCKDKEIASLRVTMEPPPYQTWWAYTLYFLLFTAIVLGFVRSQRKKLKYERSVNERLRQVDRLKDEFLANTSHELRTPLNGIIGIADSLMKGATGPLPPQTIENLRMVTSSGKRLSHLVNDILDYSKLKEKDLDLQLKGVGLRSLTDVVLLLSKPLTAGKQLVLENHIGEEIPLVYADENRLEQVMHNLVENAIKFTDAGKVTVSAELTEDRGIPMVKLTVTDTGIGIPKEKHGDIFKSFEQVDMSSTRQYGGTGLGLSISAKLVELHNGAIGVESEPGKGSAFWFTIPVMQENSASNPASATSIFSEPQNGSIPSSIPARQLPVENNNNHTAVDLPCRILAVDDEIVNLQVLANHLSLHRYTVIKAMNGIDALNIISEPATRPDIVLLDVMMPRMSGYEVCVKIREMYSASELPIIMLTAKNQMANLLEGLDSGANDYITKPFSSDELLERIKVHLQLLKANRDLKGANEKLADYNRTLEQKVAERTMELREKNRLIMDSINFAQRVQEDILPLDEKIRSALPNHFIIFKPRDIVSGDFYWFEQVGETIFLAVVDCTGHGVPGALMSMIGYTILNKLVIEQKLDDPAVILEYLHKDVRAALKQRRGRHVDTAGMDIGLCKISNNTVTFSGAHIPLYIVKHMSNETEQIKGDRKTIGGLQMHVDLTFSNTRILLEPGDMLYLISDGFTDQHSPKGKKYGKKNMRNLLARIASMDLNEQKNKALNALEKHMNGEEQRDDITVLGVRVLPGG